jgi:hypothetical protein
VQDQEVPRVHLHVQQVVLAALLVRIIVSS